MRVVIISKEKDGEKEAIGASASESQAEQYVQEEGLENCEFETVSVPTKANERIDNVYLAYKPQDGGHKVILVGYFTNRFNAQQAAQPGGHIRRIPLVENRHKSSTRPPTSTRRHPRTSRSEAQKSASVKAKEAAMANAQKVRILVGLTGLWILAMIAMAALSQSSQYEWGENKETVEFLPEYCRNVSYYLSERFKVYEFPCDEETFKRYSTEKNLKYQELESQARAKTYRQYAEIEWNNPEGLSDAEQWNLWKNLSQPAVERGYKIDARIGFDGDVHGLYDRNSQRMYYWEKAAAQP